MSILFRTERVMKALDAIARSHPLWSEVEPFFGDASVALGLFPETASLVRVLARPELRFITDRYVPVLQRRIPEVARRFEGLFPIRPPGAGGGEYSGEDLVTRSLEPALRITSPLHEVVVAAGGGELGFVDLPIRLGGLFVFRDGAAEVHWDTRLDTESATFPTSVAVAIGDRENYGTLCLPPSWEGLASAIDDLVSRLVLEPGGERYSLGAGPIAGRIAIDRGSKTFTSRLTLDREEGGLSTESRIQYRSDPLSREIEGVDIVRHASSPWNSVHRWQLIDFGVPGGPELDPDFTQYFFTPGNVLEVSGLGGPLPDFDLARIAVQVLVAKGFAKKWKAPTGTVDVGALRSSDGSFTETKIDFGARHRTGLPVDWRYWIEGSHLEITALSVTQSTVDDVQRYLKAIWKATLSARGLARGVRQEN